MKSLKTVTIIFASALTLLSCKKEGCTDNDAVNFDADAKKSNNTCQFEGSAVFWYGEATSEALILNGVTSLKYYVDNTLVGSTSSDVYFTGAPDCGQNGSITVTKDLGSVKGKSYEYSVEDQLGVERWSGIINIEAGVCVTQELEW